MSGFLGVSSITIMAILYSPFILVAAIFGYFKKYLVSGFILSAGAQIIFFFDIGNRFYRLNGLQWFQYFVVYIWPVLNIFFLFYIFWRVFKNRKK